MKTKQELCNLGIELCCLAASLVTDKQQFKLNSPERLYINQEIILIDWEVRELAKLTGRECIV